MMNVAEYIKLILKKKKWTNMKLCRELNKIEENLGEARTCKQNITNYLNGRDIFRPKVLVKYEKALGLPFGTLLQMVSLPVARDSKRELYEIIEKVYGKGKRLK